MDSGKEEMSTLVGIDFFQLAKREPNPRVRIRLLALGHLQSGKTKSEVISMFRVSFPTLRSWLLRFIQEGVDGLREKPGRGRKRKLSQSQEDELRQQIERMQQNRQGGKVSAKDVQSLLKDKFGVDHALPSVYHLLERCGMSGIAARAKHPKTALRAQKRVKKISRNSGEK